MSRSYSPTSDALIARPSRWLKCTMSARASIVRFPRLCRGDCPDGVRQRRVELGAGGDLQLGEDLAEVVLDRPRTDEKLRADRNVRESVSSEPRNLDLLRGQLVAGLDCAFARRLSRGHELATGTLGESVSPDRGEHLVGHVKVLARVHTPAGS